MVFLIFILISSLFIGCSSNSADAIIKNNYINKSKKLDKYSHIIKKDEASILVNGSYRGVGLKLINYKNRTYVLDVVENSEANNCGIKASDELVKLNNIALEGKEINSIYNLINKQSDNFTLTLKRDHKSLYKCTLHNKVIHLNNIKVKIFPNKTAYIKIKRFQKGTAKEVLSILNKENIKHIIFDLRDNRGGVVDEAIELLDIFIKNKTILYEKRKNDKYEYKANAFAKNYIDISILVNSNTASASEIFAGVMQYYNKAVIFGTKTFGKGTIQTIYNLDDNKALKLTTAKFYLPSMKSIDNIGIIPDKNVEINEININNYFRYIK